MYTCVDCKNQGCNVNDKENLPKNCPMINSSVFENVLDEYHKEENQKFFVTSAEVEAAGYGEWTRMREVVEFSKRMGYKKLGIACCLGLSNEGKIAARILRDNGFEVVSVLCKTGSIPKESAGIPKEKKIHPDEFEPMCNPIAQARLLNEQKTEFNIAIGLCVGHDSLFYKFSEAKVTTLVAKDRVLAHNPVGALYCAESYYKNKL